MIASTDLPCRRKLQIDNCALTRRVSPVLCGKSVQGRQFVSSDSQAVVWAGVMKYTTVDIMKMLADRGMDFLTTQNK